MMYRPIELKYDMFQLSTFASAGNVYCNLQATKTALKTAQLKQQNKQVASKVIARGDIAAAAL